VAHTRLPVVVTRFYLTVFSRYIASVLQKDALISAFVINDLRRSFNKKEQIRSFSAVPTGLAMCTGVM